AAGHALPVVIDSGAPRSVADPSACSALPTLVLSATSDPGAPCATGFEECGSTCADTSSDRAHCGGCGQSCEAGFVCAAGACVDGSEPLVPADAGTGQIDAGTAPDASMEDASALDAGVAPPDASSGDGGADPLDGGEGGGPDA